MRYTVRCVGNYKSRLPAYFLNIVASPTKSAAPKVSLLKFTDLISAICLKVNLSPGVSFV